MKRTYPAKGRACDLWKATNSRDNVIILPVDDYANGGKIKVPDGLADDVVPTMLNLLHFEHVRDDVVAELVRNQDGSLVNKCVKQPTCQPKRPP